ncbi:uncharacterized protein N7498_009737 [Penicillium cinerascens]|uniref:Uncharacterized protein n=1 Tax=Penicillium cinerascens TaxID=70096 RepID=A0A9W9J6Z8_9EURO|nr:uncharacterized protein N7498_009737 [Penicillium cinerascens]KAJ5190752.1 hypothetical protein N7498_009737 [Penicillium cinerascens]
MSSAAVKREASPDRGLELVYRVREQIPPSQQSSPRDEKCVRKADYLFGNPTYFTVLHADWVDTSTLSYTHLYKDLQSTPCLRFQPGRCLLLPRHFTREEKSKKQVRERLIHVKSWLMSITLVITVFYNGRFPQPNSPVTTWPRIHLVVRQRVPRRKMPLKRIPLDG